MSREAASWDYAFQGVDSDAVLAALTVWLGVFKRWARANGQLARKKFPWGPPWPEPHLVARYLAPTFRRKPPGGDGDDPWTWWPPSGSVADAETWARCSSITRGQALHAPCPSAWREAPLQRTTVLWLCWTPDWPDPPGYDCGPLHFTQDDSGIWVTDQPCGIWCELT